jgi:hypothetical protein
VSTIHRRPNCCRVGIGWNKALAAVDIASEAKYPEIVSLINLNAPGFW